LPAVWLVTAQLCARFSVQLPVFEINAPIQKIKYARCRNTPSALEIVVPLFALFPSLATTDT